MKLTKKLAYPSVIAALCICSYQTSQARDWDRGGYYEERPVYNNEVTYNTFPRGAKVVGGANYTIRGRYDDPLSEKLVNIGAKIQVKKNETVQRYDEKVSTIIDNEVEKALDRIEGTIDTPAYAHSNVSLGHPHVVDHHGVVASSVIPAHSSYSVYPTRRTRSAMYVGGSFNYGIFHGVGHIRNGLGASALVGLASFESSVSAEFAFNYNRYNLGTYYGVPVSYARSHSFMNNINQLEEYSGSVNVRYQLIDNSALRPALGLVAAYRYRTYSPWTRAYDHYTSVDAIDCGISAGLDFVISDKVSFGVDYRYMLNLHHAVDGFYQDDLWGRGYYGLGNIENLSYMMLNFTTRLYF